jgi:hypothetical protein
LKSIQKKIPFAFILFIAALVGNRVVCADGNPNDFIHSRTYFGVVGTLINVSDSGLFNGTSYSRVDTPQYEVDLIPALARNIGYGILAGHREEAYALEVSFWQSNLPASFGPANLGSPSGQTAVIGSTYNETAVYDSVNVSFKRYFITESHFQPFVNLGVSFPWITVPNAAADGSLNTPDIGSVTFAGLGLDLGIGAEYYLNPNISFVAGAYQRWASFNEFKGFASQYYQLAQADGSTNGDGSGFVFELGTTVGFQ